MIKWLRTSVSILSKDSFVSGISLMLSDASKNSDISACSMANASYEFALGFFLGLLHCLQLEAAHVLLMTLHIAELTLETFGLVLGKQFMFQ
jgi:hypothetical protein